MAAVSSYALPDMYSFPPFFTLQIVDETREKQLVAWRDLIVGWHAANKESMLVVADWPLWENTAIQRKMSPEGITAVMDFLVKSGYGEWEETEEATRTRARCRVFWKSVADWGALIYDYARSHGLIGDAKVYTVYDIHSDDEWAGQPFSGQEPGTILRAVELLRDQGKAALGASESIDETTVKFL